MTEWKVGDRVVSVAWTGRVCVFGKVTRVLKRYIEVTAEFHGGVRKWDRKGWRWGHMADTRLHIATPAHDAKWAEQEAGIAKRAASTANEPEWTGEASDD